MLCTDLRTEFWPRPYNIGFDLGCSLGLDLPQQWPWRRKLGLTWPHLTLRLKLWPQLPGQILALAQPWRQTFGLDYIFSGISVVIPFVTVLCNILSKAGNDVGVKAMKATMLDSLNKCFAGIHQDVPYITATLNDRCFKDKFFSKHVLTTVKADVLLAFNAVNSTASERANSTTESNSDSQAPLPKRPCLENSVVWDCMEKTVQSVSVAHHQASTTLTLNWRSTSLSQWLPELTTCYCDGDRINHAFQIWLQWLAYIWLLHRLVFHLNICLVCLVKPSAITEVPSCLTMHRDRSFLNTIWNSSRTTDQWSSCCNSCS